MPASGPINRSVASALGILLDVARSHKPQSFSELRKRRELPKATLHKLLATLEALGFVRRDDNTGKYSLGVTAGEIAVAEASHPEDLPNLLGHVVQRLVEDWNEMCHLGILEGSDDLILKRVSPPEQVVRLATSMARRHPAHATAGGLAALAIAMDDPLVRSLPDRLSKLTKNTIGSREALVARLRKVREAGYAFDLEEAYPGVRCVGVAVAVPRWPIVHISFSVPLQRAPMERLQQLATPLLAAVKEIERVLSALPPADSVGADAVVYSAAGEQR